jgi:Zn-finger protein
MLQLCDDTKEHITWKKVHKLSFIEDFALINFPELFYPCKMLAINCSWCYVMHMHYSGIKRENKCYLWQSFWKARRWSEDILPLNL